MYNALLAQMLDLDTPTGKYSNVYVYVEDDLFYPIKTVRKDKDGNYIIVCKNIKRAKPE